MSVVITHTAPKEIPIGQEVEVNLIINKGNFSGPGRLKLGSIPGRWNISKREYE